MQNSPEFRNRVFHPSPAIHVCTVDRLVERIGGHGFERSFAGSLREEDIPGDHIHR